MDKRIFGVIAIAIATLTLGVMLGSGVGQVSLVETPTFSGNLLVTVETESGTSVYEVNNLVVTIGKTRVKDYLRLGTTAADPATEFISLSDDATPLVSWTVLPGEIVGSGLVRIAGTVTDIPDVAFTVSHKFNCTADDVPVKCSGLHWAVSGDLNLWAAAAFTATTLNDGDNITITWTVTHNS